MKAWVGGLMHGLSAGGELEAHSCYEEAVNAVFNRQLTWRHMQPHCSRRDGKAKWSMIEMWPMHVMPPLLQHFTARLFVLHRVHVPIWMQPLAHLQHPPLPYHHEHLLMVLWHHESNASLLHAGCVYHLSQHAGHVSCWCLAAVMS